MKNYEALLAWVLDKHEDRALTISAHIIDAWEDDDAALVSDWDFTITAATREEFSAEDPNSTMSYAYEASGATLDEASAAVLAFIAEASR